MIFRQCYAVACLQSQYAVVRRQWWEASGESAALVSAGVMTLADGPFATIEEAQAQLLRIVAPGSMTRRCSIA